MSKKKKKYYFVTLETSEVNNNEAFFMYRGYGRNKRKALKVAKMLSKFFPYEEYKPVQVIIEEYDADKNDVLSNRTIIYKKILKSEF